MKVSIHELAAKEFDEAIEWYENQSEGLHLRKMKLPSGLLHTCTESPGTGNQGLNHKGYNTVADLLLLLAFYRGIIGKIDHRC